MSYIKFEPTKTNGRVLQGQTAFGDFRVEWDATGRLVGQTITIKTPPPRPKKPKPMPAGLMRPVGQVPEGYVPTPGNATDGGCGCDPPLE